MVETLSFRLRLSHGKAFELDVTDAIPLKGVTAIAGPSGGGKTTLLRALAGLEACQESNVRFRDTVWDGPEGHVATEDRRIGFVFQEPALFPHLNVERNLRYGARRRDVENIDAIVEALGLGDLMQRSVPRLSGGEARRVALGRALAANPTILMLDEPLSGLDRERKAELIPYIGRAVAEAQVPALYVTHSMHEVTALADRVMGIENGRLTGWQQPPSRLRATVVETMSDHLTVRIQGAHDGVDADLTLPLFAGLGETIGLGLPLDSYMVSAVNPGRTDALLTLPATVAEGPDGLTLDVFGQSVALPRGGLHAVGAHLWVSILQVSARPEVGDSAKIRR